MPLIEAESLYKSYDGREILKDISLVVDRGEVFTLIGPTGAGKTTLLRLLDLLDKPTSGRVLFDGVDIAGSRQLKLAARRRMAYVLQKPVMFNATVYDNVVYGLKWRGIANDDLFRRAKDILELVGLYAYRNRNARTLSGGEAQRVAIARAMIVEPEVLLLDEPTANLDPTSTTKIEELLSHIIRQRRTTIVMSTHDMTQGQRLADRIAVLVNGEIQQVGEARQVFSLPSSREVAEFVGVDNIIDGVVTSRDGDLATLDANVQHIEAITDFKVGERVHACIRPEEVTLSLSRTSSSARNSFSGEVAGVVVTGAFSHVYIDCGFPLTALVTTRSAEEMALTNGKSVYAAFKATAVHVLKATEEN